MCSSDLCLLCFWCYTMVDSFSAVNDLASQKSAPFNNLDKKFMRRALALAKKGWGHVASNPMVGCVIAKGSEIIAEGYHQEYGGGHAEVQALGQLKKVPQGATMYVTLEPCSHHGKTPPCVDAIIKSGIQRVVIGASDPNPKAAGGALTLSNYSVVCQTGLMADQSKSLNRAFFIMLEKQRPMIALKMASTLNGYIARSDGSSQWITSLEARKRVHYLRGGYQAILVGNETLLKDNPRLDCRFYNLPNPARICIDRHGRLPAALNIFNEGKVFYFSHSFRTDLPSHIQQVYLEDISSYEMIVSQVLDYLLQAGINSLFVEGGAKLASLLIDLGLVDYGYLFFGGKYFRPGGANAFAGSIERGFAIEKVSKLGNSVLLEGVFECSQEL